MYVHLAFLIGGALMRVVHSRFRARAQRCKAALDGGLAILCEEGVGSELGESPHRCDPVRGSEAYLRDDEEGAFRTLLCRWRLIGFSAGVKTGHCEVIALVPTVHAP